MMVAKTVAMVLILEFSLNSTKKSLFLRTRSVGGVDVGVVVVSLVAVVASVAVLHFLLNGV